MKRFPTIAMSLLLMLVATGFRSAEAVPHYVIKVRPNATGVRLECVTGCKWASLSATCETEPCEFVIDESGLVPSKH
jgi:hypothetical protein